MPKKLTVLANNHFECLSFVIVEQLPTIRVFHFSSCCSGVPTAQRLTEGDSSLVEDNCLEIKKRRMNVPSDA